MIFNSINTINPASFIYTALKTSNATIISTIVITIYKRIAFIEDYKTFIDSVREIQPDATIYVENILPVSKKLSDEDEIYNNKNVKKFNKLLKRMCKDYGDIIYLDVASSVTVDGVLPADASTDGRHCNQEYCKKWLEYIRQNVYVRQ